MNPVITRFLAFKLDRNPFSKIFMKEIFFYTVKRNLWLSEPKAFSMERAGKNSLIFKLLVISKLSDTEFRHLYINWPFTSDVWLADIKLSSVFLTRSAKLFEARIVSILSSKIGLLFLINLLALSSFFE